jgi:hypothetical protein
LITAKVLKKKEELNFQIDFEIILHTQVNYWLWLCLLYSLQSERRKKMNQYQMANTLMHLWKILGAPYNIDIIRYRKNFSIELRF